MPYHIVSVIEPLKTLEEAIAQTALLLQVCRCMAQRTEVLLRGKRHMTYRTIVASGNECRCIHCIKGNPYRCAA
eukprot:3909544-Amphidinium_carterae.1